MTELKRNFLLLLVLACVVAFLCVGCTEEADAKHTCVKCGDEADTLLSGSADMMRNNGISIRKCRQVTSTVYAAYVCDSCMD